MLVNNKIIILCGLSIINLFTSYTVALSSVINYKQQTHMVLVTLAGCKSLGEGTCVVMGLLLYSSITMLCFLFQKHP